MPRYSSVLTNTAYNWTGVTESPYEPEYFNQTMAFVQAATPTGWVRDSTYNEHTIRITNGASITSGGTQDFSSMMVSSYSIPYTATFPFSTAPTTITLAQTAAHTHTATNTWRPTTAATVFTAGGTGPVGAWQVPAGTTGLSLSYPGSSTAVAHSHSTSFTAPATTTVNMALKYIDVLHATKSPE